MSFEAGGFALFSSVVDESTLEELRAEFTRLHSGGTAGVRNVLEQSPLIASLANSEALVRHLPASGLKPVRSLLFDKTPEANWPVAWHQDRTITVKDRHEVDGYSPWTFKNQIHHVEPPAELLAKMVTLRIHLDDGGPENGPLSIVPGSHCQGKIPPDHIAGLADANATVITCVAGDVFMMRPLLLHSSRRAAKPGHRRVIHLEFADPEILEQPLSWAEWGG
ncbi:MAG: phytanoyl-CoA dioxygenase family protein [Verrucomicrobiales bacterium]|nr:phytanoyl-CoA dioxygenase family protein [Verrucomicrobiales bacterium]